MIPIPATEEEFYRMGYMGKREVKRQLLLGIYDLVTKYVNPEAVLVHFVQHIPDDKVLQFLALSSSGTQTVTAIVASILISLQKSWKKEPSWWEVLDKAFLAEGYDEFYEAMNPWNKLSSLQTTTTATASTVTATPPPSRPLTLAHISNASTWSPGSDPASVGLRQPNGHQYGDDRPVPSGCPYSPCASGPDPTVNDPTKGGPYDIDDNDRGKELSDGMNDEETKMNGDESKMNAVETKMDGDETKMNGNENKLTGRENKTNGVQNKKENNTDKLQPNDENKMDNDMNPKVNVNGNSTGKDADVNGEKSKVKEIDEANDDEDSETNDNTKCEKDKHQSNEPSRNQSRSSTNPPRSNSPPRQQRQTKKKKKRQQQQKAKSAAAAEDQDRSRCPLTMASEATLGIGVEETHHSHFSLSDRRAAKADQPQKTMLKQCETSMHLETPEDRAGSQGILGVRMGVEDSGEPVSDGVVVIQRSSALSSSSQPEPWDDPAHETELKQLSTSGRPETLGGKSHAINKSCGPDTFDVRVHGTEVISSGNLEYLHVQARETELKQSNTSGTVMPWDSRAHETELKQPNTSGAVMPWDVQAHETELKESNTSGTVMPWDDRAHETELKQFNTPRRPEILDGQARQTKVERFSSSGILEASVDRPYQTPCHHFSAVEQPRSGDNKDIELNLKLRGRPISQEKTSKRLNSSGQPDTGDGQAREIRRPGPASSSGQPDTGDGQAREIRRPGPATSSAQPDTGDGQAREIRRPGPASSSGRRHSRAGQTNSARPRKLKRHPTPPRSRQSWAVNAIAWLLNKTAVTINIGQVHRLIIS